MSYKVSATEIAQITALLGREPRGLQAIPVRSKSGEPMVIQVDSIVDNKPFPTLFWLVDKGLNLAIDQLEARGTIAALQAEIDASEDLQSALIHDHQAHIKLRSELMSADTTEKANKLGFIEVLNTRGIGGIANFQRIRCLHTWYAAHLVVPNTIGKLVDQRLH